MRFLLDTSVISEFARPFPEPGVVAWLSATEPKRLFLSVTTVAEIKHGVERMPDGRRKRQLAAWLESVLLPSFGERVLPHDTRIAEQWGTLVARAQSIGRPVGPMDAWIAATAACHGLTVITRDARDFAALDVPHLDPAHKPRR